MQLRESVPTALHVPVGSGARPENRALACQAMQSKPKLDSTSRALGLAPPLRFSSGSAGDATAIGRATHAGHDAFVFLARCIGTEEECFARADSTGLRGTDTAAVARAVDCGLDLMLYRRGFCIARSGLLGLGGCSAAGGQHYIQSNCH
jgi:hypothetical protein